MLRGGGGGVPRGAHLAGDVGEGFVGEGAVGGEVPHHRDLRPAQQEVQLCDKGGGKGVGGGVRLWLPSDEVPTNTNRAACPPPKIAGRAACSVGQSGRGQEPRLSNHRTRFDWSSGGEPKASACRRWTRATSLASTSHEDGGTTGGPSVVANVASRSRRRSQKDWIGARAPCWLMMWTPPPGKMWVRQVCETRQHIFGREGGSRLEKSL